MTTPTLRRRLARAEEALRTRQVKRVRQRAFDERPPLTWAFTVGVLEALIESGRIPRNAPAPECVKSHTWHDLCDDCKEWDRNLVLSWQTGTP
jgi:hypothetical protein